VNRIAFREMLAAADEFPEALNEKAEFAVLSFISEGALT
jgi:hypothetical protein